MRLCPLPELYTLDEVASHLRYIDSDRERSVRRLFSDMAFRCCFDCRNGLVMVHQTALPPTLAPRLLRDPFDALLARMTVVSFFVATI